MIATAVSFSSSKSPSLTKLEPGSQSISQFVFASFPQFAKTSFSGLILSFSFSLPSALIVASFSVSQACQNSGMFSFSKHISDSIKPSAPSARKGAPSFAPSIVSRTKIIPTS